MLHAALDKKNAGIIIRGEFFELDEIYFMNERLAGTYGIDNVCLLDGYSEAASILKGLNYEIRHAENGDRELYTSYNGIHGYWFAPAGTPSEQIIKEEELNDPDDIIREIEDVVEFDLDMDIDKFYDLDEDEQRDILEEEFLDPDHIDIYLEWLHRETWPFRSEDYPDASEKNTYLQFRIPFAEGLLYALIYRDLLNKKDEFIEKSLQQAKNNINGMGSYEIYFFRHRAPSELLLAEILMTELFSCVYSAVGNENYDTLQDNLLPVGSFNGMTDDDVKKAEQAVMKHSGSDINTVLHFMEALRK